MSAKALKTGLFFIVLVASTIGYLAVRTHDTKASLVPYAVASVPVTERDLGITAAGQVLQTKFQVTNDGGRRLILQHVTSSCPCVSARSEPVVLLPGESKFMSATVDTSELDGKFEMEMDYTTSDPNLPTFTLKLTVNVLPNAT